jgi:hypothetical protein
MNYPIPANTQEFVELREKSINEDLVASAIAGVVQVARSNGQSLDDLMAEILEDDFLLNPQQRRSLGEVITVAWEELL